MGDDHGGVGDRLPSNEEVVDRLFFVVYIEADSCILFCFTQLDVMETMETMDKSEIMSSTKIMTLRRFSLQ